MHPSEIDHMGHMNIKQYAEKFDRATWNILIEVGFSAEYVRESGKGCAILESLTRYIRELFAGDSIFIETVVLDLNAKKIRILHRMKKSGSNELVATCEILGIHFDLKSRKSCEMPQEILKRALIYLERERKE